eukprot:12240407-Karenia_brevis.AAC.1
MPPVSIDETKCAAHGLRPHRGLGIDGIPTDGLCKLGLVVTFMTLLTNLIFKTTSYPTRWGIGLVTSLLKPGKPPNKTSSLRGIRLLCRFAALMGRILDERIRGVWQAGPEQFGFRIGTGCIEAVFTLLTLILSRTSKGQRLYVLFIDLRTAFPSISRPILIKRMFEVGLSLGMCRLVLAMFDVTASIVRLGALLGSPFKDIRG